MHRNGLIEHLKPLAPLPTDVSPGGKLRFAVDCLLCDIYGTLLISGSGDIHATPDRGEHRPEIETLLERFGLEPGASRLQDRLAGSIDQAHAEARAHGIDFPEVRIEKIWKTILPFQDKIRIEQFAMEFELIQNPAWPMPHARELLHACRKAGMRLGIISNAQFYTPLLLTWFFKATSKALGFDEDLILYSYRMGRAKPSPHLFLEARRRLSARGIAPGHVLYLGNDMRNDIAPAAQAGFQTALFAGDRRSLRLRGETICPETTPPDLIITDLQQLIHELRRPDAFTSAD